MICCYGNMTNLCIIFQFWVAYTSCSSQFKDSVEQTFEQIDVIKRMVKKYPNDLQIATSADGKILACLFLTWNSLLRLTCICIITEYFRHWRCHQEWEDCQSYCCWGRTLDAIQFWNPSISLWAWCPIHDAHPQLQHSLVRTFESSKISPFYGQFLNVFSAFPGPTPHLLTPQIPPFSLTAMDCQSSDW